MKSSTYTIPACPTCHDEKLLLDDAWDAMDMVQTVDFSMHRRIQLSRYMSTHFGACHGCFKVARRKVKVLACTLHKLDVLK